MRIGELSVGQTDFLGRLHGAGLKIFKNANNQFMLSVGWFQEGKKQGAAIVLVGTGEC